MTDLADQLTDAVQASAEAAVCTDCEGFHADAFMTELALRGFVVVPAEDDPCAGDPSHQHHDHDDLTLKEAAAQLGVTPDNLRGAIARGSLKAAKHGRDWWVLPADVERYRQEHRRNS